MQKAPLKQQYHPLLPTPTMSSGLQMVSGIPMQLGHGMYPSAPVLPGFQTFQSPPEQQGLQIPTGCPANTGARVSLGDQGSSATPGSQEPSNGPRRQRQERTVYTKEQQCVLEDHFKKCKYPSHEDCVLLAERINVKEQQIKLWFKNHRAKLSRMHRQACKKQLRRPKIDARPKCPRRPSSTPVSTRVDSGCPGTSGVSAIPQFSTDPEAFFASLDKACESLLCTAQKDSMAGHEGSVPPARAAEPAQPTEDPRADPATSAEVPVPSAGPDATHTEAPAASEPQEEEAQDTDTSAEEAWIQDLDSLDTLLDPEFELDFTLPLSPQEFSQEEFLALVDDL